MGAKVYAVAAGFERGIFHSWDGPNGARAQVDGFRGARHRSFTSEAEATAWLAVQPAMRPAPAPRAAGALPASSAPAVEPKPVAVAEAAPALAPIPDTAPHITVHLQVRGDQGLGRAAYALLLLHDGRVIELSGAHTATTQHRQRVRALAEAIAFLKCRCRLVVHADNPYLAQRFPLLDKWSGHQWDTAPGTPVQHADQWQRVAKAAPLHELSFAAPDPAYDDPLGRLLDRALAGASLPADDAQPPWQAAPPE